MPRRSLILGLLALLFLGGCSGSKMPDLNSVHGRVTRGGAPVEHVMINLVSDQLSQDFTVLGTSDSSGDVEFYTLEARTNIRRRGAPQGEYSIIVTPPMDDNQQSQKRFTLPVRLRVGEGDNNLPPIDLDKKG